MRQLGGVLQAGISTRSDESSDRTASWHLHRYTRTGDDWFSGASLYRCRCGVVRPGF